MSTVGHDKPALVGDNDQGGYPDGLAGEAIPLEARIIVCCDSWNAMRTDRAYRKALGHDAALAEMRSNSGSQFDPRIAETLIGIVNGTAEPPSEHAPIVLEEAAAHQVGQLLARSLRLDTDKT